MYYVFFVLFILLASDSPLWYYFAWFHSFVSWFERDSLSSESEFLAARNVISLDARFVCSLLPRLAVLEWIVNLRYLLDFYPFEISFSLYSIYFLGQNKNVFEISNSLTERIFFVDSLIIM